MERDDKSDKRSKEKSFSILLLAFYCENEHKLVLNILCLTLNCLLLPHFMRSICESSGMFLWLTDYKIYNYSPAN